jgi:TolA-binding protein
LKNKQKANEIYIRIVEKYPDGKKIPGMLNAALRSTSDPVEKEKFLNRIEEKTEDRMGKLCIKKIREPNIIMNQAK